MIRIRQQATNTQANVRLAMENGVAGRWAIPVDVVRQARSQQISAKLYPANPDFCRIPQFYCYAISLCWPFTRDGKGKVRPACWGQWLIRYLLPHAEVKSIQWHNCRGASHVTISCVPLGMVQEARQASDQGESPGSVAAAMLHGSGCPADASRRWRGSAPRTRPAAAAVAKKWYQLTRRSSGLLDTLPGT